MSFFSNCPADRCPGRLSGNPLNGLCDKVCVQAKKVFTDEKYPVEEVTVNYEVI